MTIPATVANDLGALQSSLESLAERMGHAQCASGCDILHLQQEREFAVLKDGNLQGQNTPTLPSTLFTPQPVPWRSVMVTIPTKVSGNIEALSKAVEVAMGKLGCPACCSGFDISFQREFDALALDDQLQVQGFGRFR